MSDTYVMGDLAAQDLYPDESKMQPPQEAWPYQAQTALDPQGWQAPPTKMAQWPASPPPATDDEQQAVRDASMAAANKIRMPYRDALARDPSSNRLNDVADFLAPQTPLDYALLASGGMGKGLKMASLAAGAVMAPTEAQAGPVNRIIKGLGEVAGYAPSLSGEAASRVVKYGNDIPYLRSDPFHSFTKLRTGTPIDEMSATFRDVPIFDRPLVKPEDLLGKEIIFTPGDRTAAGGVLTKVGDTKLTTPQKMEGGADYPFNQASNPIEGAPNAQRLWANAPGASTAQLNLGNSIVTQGREPVLMYQAMGKLSGDSSKQMALPAIDLARQGSITRAGADFINQKMADIEDFPGWRSSKLLDWVNSTTGTNRSQLVKAMDMGEAQEAGFPDLGQLRYAITNPHLRGTPTGSVGLTVSSLDPSLGRIENSLHSTYPTAVAGGNAGTMGGSIPWHVAAPDIHESLMKLGDPVRYAERPDYYSIRMPEGLPRTQVVDNKWVDTVSDWIRKNPSMWTAAGAVPMGGLAAQNKYSND